MSKIPPDYIRGRLDTQLWRLENLYWIENKSGSMQRFRLNAAQKRLHSNLWYRNDILKARQLGISTYVALLMLDMCLFTPNFHAGIIDKTVPDAQQKLDKIRFAWEHLDFEPAGASPGDKALAWVGGLVKKETGVARRGSIAPPTDARTRMVFANGSDIRIGSTLRGGTLQFLHVSELAHVSVHSPWRAKEIRTGTINTVPANGYIIKESTHEGGRFGVNYELTRQAMENAALPQLTPLDFRFFFLSWFDHESYSLDGRGGWSRDMTAYFDDLATRHGIALSPGQKRWYARMARTMGASMKQEYPSTPDEAFSAGNEESIYGPWITRLREQGRVGGEWNVNREEDLYTSWDLGLSDHTAIWLVQCYGGCVYWFDHYAANQFPLEHYAMKIREWEKAYGPVAAHLLPHDAARRDPHGHSYVESLGRYGIDRVRVVPRTPDVWRGINALRELLPKSYFHVRTLASRVNLKGEKEPGGLTCLEMYRTIPPGRGGALAEMPLHDASSHSADAARTFAEAHAHGLLGSAGRGPRRALM